MSEPQTEGKEGKPPGDSSVMSGEARGRES